MTTNPDNNPSPTVPGGTHVEPSVGGENVDATLSLADINKTLGRDYKDVPSALAALKETYSFVGKAPKAPEVQPTSTATNDAPPAASKADVDALKVELFFSKHPEYEAHRSLIAKMGGEPSEVVGSTEFKEVFEKVKVADEVSRQRSVVSSNSRLSQTKTATDEAVRVANASGGSVDEVANTLAQAVKEAYEMQ